jgi:signal recognition particle receptor subunit beta
MFNHSGADLVKWSLKILFQRLAGSSLLVFANKQDIQGALKPDEMAKVKVYSSMDDLDSPDGHVFVSQNSS